MDSYEASSLIYSKVNIIDPENATKIMGYILIQDMAEKDLMRLAFGPENLLHSMVIRAKIHLGLSSNNSSTKPSSPSTLNPIARPSSLAVNCGNPFSQSSPRIIPNGFPLSPSPSSPSTRSWPLSGLSNNNANTNNTLKSNPLLPYDNIRSTYGGGGEGSTSTGAAAGELMDETHLSDHLSFLSEDLAFHPDWAHSKGDAAAAHFHRRSLSASDASFGSDEYGGGGGFKACLYFDRGFCKNGSTCKFVHGDGGGFISDQAEAEHHEEMMRLKAAAAVVAAEAAQQQQRLMAGLSPKYMNFILQQQQQQHDPQRAAAMMMGEEIYKFGRCRPERNDFLSMAERMNSALRQIYLTFPAESTFKDEDVSEYFNKFGPVQDVRIPYQQKRMFGFVTFVHPETVRFILSKGNPHFICDSRVLVKPYKEKGKVLDKRQQHQQHQLERGEFSTCLGRSGLDSREAYDFPIGRRMFYNAQESLLRRKLDQVELQQAIEFQGRRLMNLQLPEFKNDRLHHHQRSLSVGASVLLPHQSFSPSSQNFNLPFDNIKHDVAEDLDDGPVVTVTLPAAVPARLHQQDETLASMLGDGKDEVSFAEDLDLYKSVEQALPDNLFSSPTKLSGDHLSDFSTAAAEEVNESATTLNETNSLLPNTSAGF